MRGGAKTVKGNGWQGWFAWRPVRAHMDDGRYCWVWWEHIERHYAVMACEGWWEYQIPKERR